MLKYLILFLLSFTCLASETKFHFMDCVKITKGFYKNCKGNVTSYHEGDSSSQPTYGVEVDNCKLDSFFATFNENELEGCKK